VPRNWTWASCWALLAAAIALAPSGQAAAQSEALLPATTKVFISITDPEEFSEHWNKTQLGQLAQDPVMKPFVDDLRRQWGENRAKVGEKLGLTLGELSTVPGRDVSAAIVQLPQDRGALVLLADVTGRREESRAFLDELAAKLVNQGAKQASISVSGRPALRFDFPKPADAASRRDQQPRQTFYCLVGDCLVGADNLDVFKGILARLEGGRDDTLADAPAFRAVMDRCAKDAGRATPQVRWFLDPFAYARIIQAAVPEEDRTPGKTTVEQLEATGFAAFRGIGGFIDVGTDDYEVLHRTAIWAPKPWNKSMKMLVFPNAAHSKPPSWVPRDVATYATFNCDMLNALDNFGPLFDEVAAEGEEGIWIEEVLPGMLEDEDGPQIDLRGELFAHMTGQVIVLRDNELPITTTSERLLIAVAVDDPKTVQKAIAKLQDDSEVRQYEFQGHVIRETIPKTEVKVAPVEIVPPPGVAPQQPQGQMLDEPLLPNGAMTVAGGYWLIASHADFLIKVLTPIDERETLAHSVDYLIVEDAIKRLAPEANCLVRFSRTDEEYRPTYELIRQGKMPQGETMLARILNALADTDETGVVRQQRIDGSKAPPFEVVRRHLGPAGLFAVSEEDGWFLKGFMLKK